ncbi:Uncharacterized protein T12_5362 [Trichinella patagoniensis]|uniref:Uncharacterized protein n=1 Tax=Trichinella patagoniensis TaxID=990121 RepID=A0A0V0ZPL2_9BILA|nr:Uncharacterized protein T12_5362 [Trichinella patagoniensis]
MATLSLMVVHAFLCYLLVVQSAATKFRRSPCAYGDDLQMKNLQNCLESVRNKAADASIYWFGDRMKAACSGSILHNSPAKINCYNPPTLRPYESIFSRLFRITTFHPAYLQNLKIFPQMTFFSEPGEYEACDHIFVFPKSETVHAHPGMQPAKPWQVRHVPVITWSNMATHSYQTVLMVDVGSGRLQYLAYNYPKDTVVLKEYEVPLNSRDSPNPIALLVFEQNSGRRLTLNIDYSFDEDSLFDVQRFIIDNEFHETQILFATEMLHRTDSVRPEFLPPSLLATVDTWMTVTFHSPLIHFSVCCKEFVFDSADIKLDPLGDSEIDPVYLRQSPSISVSNYFLNTALSHLHYHSPYDYSNPDDAPLYTLLMLDVDASDKMGSASRPYVIWLVTNFAISSHLNNALTGSIETTVFSYSRPLPQNDGSITHIKPELYSSESCPTEYNGRCFFDVREFMAHHSLTLKGISWMRSKEDEYVKYEYLSREPHSDSICGVENMNCIPRASQYSSSSIFIISSSTSLFSFYATWPTSLWLLYWAFNRHCRDRVATAKKHGVQSVERSRVILDHQEGYGGRLVVSLGAIEPSTMPWGLPEVLMQKKDGSPFLRRLSQTEHRDADPRIDDTLNALPRARLMETAMRGLTWKTCFFHLDDIIMFRKTQEEPLERLTEVEERIMSVALKI